MRFYEYLDRKFTCFFCYHLISNYICDILIQSYSIHRMVLKINGYHNSQSSASIEEINKFLFKYKTLLIKNRGIEFEPRTFDGITNLGLDIELAKKEILSLTYYNYDRGPTPDHNLDGTDIWEFGMLYEDELVYIKLKIKSGRCICLSFKQSSGPFTLSYKNW